MVYIVQLAWTLGVHPQHCIKTSYSVSCLYSQHLGGWGRRREDLRFKVVPDFVVSLRSVWSTWDPIESGRAWEAERGGLGTTSIPCSHLWNGHILWLPWKHYPNHFHWLLIKYEAQRKVSQKVLTSPLSIDNLSKARAQLFCSKMLFSSVKIFEVRWSRCGAMYLWSQAVVSRWLEKMTWAT